MNIIVANFWHFCCLLFISIHNNYSQTEECVLLSSRSNSLFILYVVHCRSSNYFHEGCNEERNRRKLLQWLFRKMYFILNLSVIYFYCVFKESHRKWIHASKSCGIDSILFSAIYQFHESSCYRPHYDKVCRRRVGFSMFILGVIMRWWKCFTTKIILFNSFKLI